MILFGIERAQFFLIGRLRKNNVPKQCYQLIEKPEKATIKNKH